MKWLVGLLVLLGFLVLLLSAEACRHEPPYDPFPSDPAIPPDCERVDCE